MLLRPNNQNQKRTKNDRKIKKIVIPIQFGSAKVRFIFWLPKIINKKSSNKYILEDFIF